MSLLLFFFVTCNSALAYPPELLLERAKPPISNVDAPGGRQYLNPFSQVGMGYTRLDLEEDEHEFSLQLRPKSLGEARAYKKLSRSLETESELSRKILRSKSLQAAYTVLIHAALAKEQNAFTQEWKKIMERNQKLSSLEARRSQLDVKNVLKANADWQKSMNEMIVTESQVLGVSSFLLARGLRLEELETEDLLHPEEILARLEKVPTASAGLSAQKITSELEVERASLRHAIAQRSHLLDDIKVAMRQEKKDTSYRVELSFNLPFLAAQDLDEIRDKMKLAESEVETYQALVDENQRAAGIAEILRRKISLFRTVGADPKWEKSATAVLRQDPALALELQRTSVGRKLTRASLLAEIRQLYVDLLHESGLLAQEDSVNQLSKSGRKL